MKNRVTQRRSILPLIVVAQFLCTSLWFAVNGVMTDLVTNFDIQQNDLAHLISMVQFGFIAGTLLFAIFSIADRFSPSKVFFCCAILGALFNLGTIWPSNQLYSLLGFRFFTGFFLAGIYPVGMKIAADYYEKGLGQSLGYLVGALVVGTATPHLLKNFGARVSWDNVIIITSSMACLGGLLIFTFVPDGPFRKASQKIQMTAVFNIFKRNKFRSAAFGYFGHMWELYAFWTFVPWVLLNFRETHNVANLNIPLISFLVIAIGGLACVIGGRLSLKISAKSIATFALTTSGLCCLISPVFLMQNSSILLVAFLFFWGMVVVADSPLFSTLVAQSAPSELKGTALTIVNCIGFTITIISIQLLNVIVSSIKFEYIFVLLAIGPILGVLSLSFKTHYNE